MGRQTGITGNTFSRFMIDAGAVYRNYGLGNETLLGATRGGNEFKIETEERVMEADGAIGNVRGGRRIVNVNAMITCNFVEIKPALLDLMLPGSASSDYGTPVTHRKLRRAGDIEDPDYITNIAIVGNSTYSDTNYVVVILENVLSDGNITLSFAPKEEVVIPITFVAHFDPSTLDNEPWEIRSPIIT